MNADTAFSFCFWINAKRANAEQTLFIKGEGCPDGDHDFKGTSYTISLLADNSICMKLFAPKGNYNDESVTCTSERKLTLNEWTCIALTYSNSSKQIKIYFDGKESPANLKYKSKPANFSQVHKTAASLKIGAEENYCGYKHKFEKYFKGSLDDIRFYTKVLDENTLKVLNDKPASKEPVFLFCIGCLIFATLLFFTLRKNTTENEIVAFPRYSLAVKVISSVALVFTYYIFFTGISNFSDDAFFGGDTWEYQSMAVNFAKGHGIQRFGELENFDEYKFNTTDSSLEKQFKAEAGNVDVYRTPGYPLFVGLSYKLFGFHPIYIKKIQLLLLILIATGLAWIGSYFWQKPGLYGGLISGALFMVFHYDMAGSILTEPLITFFIFLTIVAYIYFEIKGSITASIILGITLGIGLLVKGSLVFIPILLLLFLLNMYRKTRNKILFRNMAIISSSMAIAILPWSVYASVTTGKMIALSTQTSEVILDSNNELSTDGSWHPEWRKDVSHKENYFYNNDGMGSSSPFLRAMHFYKLHPNLLFETLKNKLAKGYSSFTFLWILIALFILESAVILIRKNFDLLKTFLFLILPLLTMLFYFFIFAPEPLVKFIETNFTSILFGIILLLPVILYLRKQFSLSIPYLLHVIFLNFLILTLLTCGLRRFIEVMDFIFILCAVQYVINFMMTIKSRLNEQ